MSLPLFKTDSSRTRKTLRIERSPARTSFAILCGVLNTDDSAPVAKPNEPNPGPAVTLERGLGLKEAVALNMIEIVGIGPFVVTSLVIKAMGGPQALVAWVAGALLAVLDAFVWSELGAAMPRAGGT